MPIVEINGQELEFPDTMSPDEIKGVLRQKFPPPQAPQQGNAGSAARAVAYGIAGGQVPFGNVITSGIGAGIAKAASPLTGDERTYRELYDQAQADTKATQEANPLATLGGNALGVVSTLPIGFTKSLSGQVPTQGARGALNAIPSGLSKVGDFVRGGAVAKPGIGQTLLRGAKAGLVSAPVAGLYGAGEADAGNRLQQGIESAGMGAAIGAALPIGGAVLGATAKGTKNAFKGMSARLPEQLGQVLGDMKDVGRDLYKRSEQLGAVLTPNAAQDISNAVSGIVKNPQTAASQSLYSKTLSALQGLNDDLARGNAGLETIDAHRQILGNLAKDIMNPNNAQEAEAARRAIDAIDNVIDNLTPQGIQNQSIEAVDALNAARKAWAQSKKFEKVADIVEKSAGDANKLKSNLYRFATNKKNTMGWTDAERQALKEASLQTTGEGILKTFGKFGFDLGSTITTGNTALPVIGSIAAGVGGSGGAAAVVPAVGTVARQAQKYIARAKAEDLLKIIEQGGNVSKQMINSLPPAQKKKFLSQVMSMPVAKATAILNNNEKVK